MRFVIPSTLLSSRLQSIGKVIVSKNTIPILDNFLFEINNGLLTLTASDSETTIRTSVELIECNNDCKFTLDARMIQDALKEIPEQPLEFVVDETTHEITIRYQNGQYNIISEFADDYPEFQSLPEECDKIAIPSNLLWSGINRALFATASDDLRPVMNGVFFDIQEKLTIVASDGHKLVCSTFSKVQNSHHSSFILPKKPALILRNVLTKDTDGTIITYTDRNAEIRTTDYIITCRLTEGRYPNYSSVIPQDNPNCAVINRSALISALRRVLVFATKTSLTKLSFSAHELQISSQDIEFSKSAEEHIFCDYSGIPMSIGFKGAFLLELINIIEGDDLVIKLADASRAGIITPAVDTEEESVLMLLMPMMLNE